MDKIAGGNRVILRLRMEKTGIPDKIRAAGRTASMTFADTGNRAEPQFSEPHFLHSSQCPTLNRILAVSTSQGQLPVHPSPIQ